MAALFERLRGLNYLIYGGTSGIGLATAGLLLKHGANVALCGRSAAKLESVLPDFNILRLPGDISSLDQCNQVTDLCFEQWGRVDVVINAAGVHAPRRRFVDLTTEDAQLIFATNTLGVFNAIKSSHRIFLKQGYGHYIQVSSAASDRPSLLAGCVYTA